MRKSITAQEPKDGQHQEHTQASKSSAGSSFPQRQHHRCDQSPPDDIWMDLDHHHNERVPKRISSLKKNGSRTTRQLQPQRSSSADQLNRKIVQVRFPGHPKPSTRTRSITFNETVRVKRIPSARELNDGKTEDLWFQSNEYDTIKRKTAALIRAIQEKKTGGVTYCTRGLETYFNAEEVQYKRHSAYRSVFGEQEVQRRSGSYDELKLCQAYEKFTHNSSVEAEERGKLDEDAIDRYVKRTRAISRIYTMPNTHRPAC